MKTSNDLKFENLMKKLLSPHIKKQITNYHIIVNLSNNQKVNIPYQVKTINKICIENQTKGHYIELNKKQRFKLMKAISLLMDNRSLKCMILEGIHKNFLPEVKEFCLNNSYETITPLKRIKVNKEENKSFKKSNLRIIKKVSKKTQKKENFRKSNNLKTLVSPLNDKKEMIVDYYDDYSNFNLKKEDKKKKNQIKKEITSLVLWDLENIHFFNDYSTISRYVKTENQIKLMAYSNKYENYERDKKLTFLLSKLKKRNWIVQKTKKIADDILKKTFNKYKNSLKEVIIISNDSDFKEILKDCIDLNIHIKVLHRNGRDRDYHWYDKADEVIDLRNL